MAKLKLNGEAQKIEEAPVLPVVNLPEGKKYYFGGELPKNQMGEQILPVIYDEAGNPRYCFTALGR